MLGKPMRWFEVVSMIACYIGIFLIVYDKAESQSHHSYSFTFGFICTFLASFCVSYSCILVVKMKELNTSIMNFWSGIGLIIYFTLMMTYELI